MAAACFISRYLGGPLPYNRKYIVSSVSISVTFPFPSYQEIDYERLHPE